jgi:large subunit ribosomal protein L15
MEREMRLNDIKDNPGSRKTRIRIGRGIGSGIGKTGGRGGKGQTARSGVAIGGFEGGQMPLHRRLPKRGFRSRSRDEFNEVTLGRLQAAVDAGRLDAGKPVDVAALKSAGLVRRDLSGVRVLGGGELKAALKLTINHATASARAAIEQAGGSIALIEKKVLQADEDKRAKRAAKRAKAGGTPKKKAEEE